MKARRVLAALACAALPWLVATPIAGAAVVFTTNFDAGLPSEFSGAANSIEGVQGYAGIGPAGNVFSGNLLRNSSTGDPATFTILTLTGLPVHDSISVGFLLAVIDSWDGFNGTPAPDIFNVRVDGSVVLSVSFAIASGASNYSPPPGGLLSSGTNLGFNNSWSDQAFNMYLESALQNIPHTASTLTIDWFASGAGWQGGDDESWGIDNVTVTTNLSAVPEPSALALALASLGGLGLVDLARRRREE